MCLMAEGSCQFARNISVCVNQVQELFFPCKTTTLSLIFYPLEGQVMYFMSLWSSYCGGH